MLSAVTGTPDPDAKRRLRAGRRCVRHGTSVVAVRRPGYPLRIS
jgi:hypothetical protein